MKEEKRLGDKRLLVVNVFVGNIDDADVSAYIEGVKTNVGLHTYEDLLVVYVPVRHEGRPSIEVVI